MPLLGGCRYSEVPLWEVYLYTYIYIVYAIHTQTIHIMNSKVSKLDSTKWITLYQPLKTQNSFLS